MRTCLVVDDSNVVRKVARRVFEILKFDVCEAGDGQEGLDLCQAAMPDAILLDGHLPVMASSEFLSSLRAMRDGRKPVVIFCTSENDRGEIARALSAGADDYVLKPFNRETIRAKLVTAGIKA
jgi:two-component system, chemotaxis family, chemotaxis protein CheY